MARYGQASEADCNMGCTGIQNEVCGGFWRNSIYRTGVQKIGNNGSGILRINLDFEGSVRHFLD